MWFCLQSPQGVSFALCAYLCSCTEDGFCKIQQMRLNVSKQCILFMCSLSFSYCWSWGRVRVWLEYGLGYIQVSVVRSMSLSVFLLFCLYGLIKLFSPKYLRPKVPVLEGLLYEVIFGLFLTRQHLPASQDKAWSN